MLRRSSAPSVRRWDTHPKSSSSISWGEPLEQSIDRNIASARREGTLALSALLHKLGCSLSSVIRKQAGAGRVVDHLTRPTERRIAAVTAAAIINTPSAAVLDISATGTGKITQVINTRRKLIKDRLIAGKLLSMVPPRSGYIGWPLRARRVVKLTRLLNLPLPQLGRAPLAVDSKHFRHFNTCFPITRQSV